MHVTIHTAAVPDGKTSISNSAAELVRMGFKPSGMERVDRIEALAAALVSECEAIRNDAISATVGGLPVRGAREASIAITEIQTASFFAVAAATAAL